MLAIPIIAFTIAFACFLNRAATKSKSSPGGRGGKRGTMSSPPLKRTREKYKPDMACTRGCPHCNYQNFPGLAAPRSKPGPDDVNSVLWLHLHHPRLAPRPLDDPLPPEQYSYHQACDFTRDVFINNNYYHYYNYQSDENRPFPHPGCGIHSMAGYVADMGDIVTHRHVCRGYGIVVAREMRMAELTSPTLAALDLAPRCNKKMKKTKTQTQTQTQTQDHELAAEDKMDDHRNASGANDTATTSRPVKKVRFNLGPSDAVPESHSLTNTIPRPTRRLGGHTFYDTGEIPASETMRQMNSRLKFNRKWAASTSRTFEDATRSDLSALVRREYYCARTNCICLAGDFFPSEEAHDAFVAAEKYVCPDQGCACGTHHKPSPLFRDKAHHDEFLADLYVCDGALTGACICTPGQFATSSWHHAWVLDNAHKCLIGTCPCHADTTRKYRDRRDHHKQNLWAFGADADTDASKDLQWGPIYMNSFVCRRAGGCICDSYEEEEGEEDGGVQEGEQGLGDRLKRKVSSGKTFLFGEEVWLRRGLHDGHVVGRMYVCDEAGCDCLYLGETFLVLHQDDMVFRNKEEHDAWKMAGGRGGSWKRKCSED